MSPLGAEAVDISIESVIGSVPMIPGSDVGQSRHVDKIIFASRDQYLETLDALNRLGFEMCVDLCATDYLTYQGSTDRKLPEGVSKERFEVVVNLLSLSRKERVRVRVQLPESEPWIASAIDIYPGVDAMEREAFDLMGIEFRGHPDLTRILMPEGWEGHPLRKDYGVGRVPVQFKNAPGPR